MYLKIVFLDYNARNPLCIYLFIQLDLAAGPIRIVYENEAGIDAGGLAKDWFQELTRKVTEGTAGLLQISHTGFVHIDPR